MLLFIFEFKAVEVVNQVSIFLSLDVVFNSNASLILASIGPQRSNGTLHVMQLLVKFFNSFRVTLLALVLVGYLTLDVVLVEFHEAGDVGLVVLELHDFLYVLCEFKNDCLLLIRLVLLLCDFNYDQVDLGLMLPQLLSVVSDL